MIIAQFQQKLVESVAHKWKERDYLLIKETINL